MEDFLGNRLLKDKEENEDPDSKLKDYCTALIQQFKSEESKGRFKQEYKKLHNEHQIAELEEKAQAEACFTSRIFTTTEAITQRKNMQRRLDQLFHNDETDEDANHAGQLNLTSLLEDEQDSVEEETPFASTQPFTYEPEAGNATNVANVYTDDPFTEEEGEYRNASFNTIKKFAAKSRPTWKVVECRSGLVPLNLQNSLNYMRVFELFTFLLADIQEQQSVLKQLKMENLGLVDVPEHETV